MLNDKRIIDQEEKNKLLKLVEKIAGNHDIEACCAYGSKISGYARADSDYDVLLVLKNYGYIVKYLYEKNNLDTSVLIVDSKALFNDAKKASLGEFVVGRLLHPYEQLINTKYLTDVEKIYKKRIVLEEIKELVATNALYAALMIPINYFLYSKLQKRAKIYPQALYSYVRTYSDDHGKRNLEKSLKSFTLASQELEKEGYIQIDNGFIKILERKINAKSGDKTSIKMSNIIRGIFSWIVHTYAGRKTLIFVKPAMQEAKSKLKRLKAINNIPTELANPRSLLKLEEGIHIEGEKWLKELATKLNFKDYSVTRNKLGDLNAATTLYSISENERKEKFVVKDFGSIKAMKWPAMNLWAAGVKKFDMNPTSRLRREYKSIRYLRSVGLNTPEIVASVPNRKLLITRYLEGTKLSEIIKSVLLNKSDDTTAISYWGQMLQILHTKGHTMMDTKASNILIRNNKFYFTDLEQFTFDDDKAWDIACFIYYSMIFTSNEEGVRKTIRAFLDGYMCNGDISIIKKALNRKYISPFYLALVLGTITIIRNEIKTYVSSYS